MTADRREIRVEDLAHANPVVDLLLRSMREITRRASAGDEEAIASLARLTNTTPAAVRDALEELNREGVRL